VKIAVAVVLLVTLAYSLVIAGQILLWFVLVGIAAGVYIAWLLVLAVFRLVDAIERIAATREAEVSGGDRTDETDTQKTDSESPNAERSAGDDVAGAEAGRDAFGDDA
jgi:hypothetical protein